MGRQNICRPLVPYAIYACHLKQHPQVTHPEFELVETAKGKPVMCIASTQ